MSRVIHWLQDHERKMFFLVNHTIQNAALNYIFPKITHLGGASFTITASLIMLLLAKGDWLTASIQSAAALALSHIPVAILKKKYPRLRPYLVLKETIIYKSQLTDHSFPSGHTTAIFSFLTPYVLFQPMLGLILLPIAFLVGISRIYIGLHYPSDVLAGMFLGTVTAILTYLFVG